jgi:Flp pilus assembly CpaE family ATPase
MFNETIPLLLTRLHDEILNGKARDVKDLTDASQVVLKMTSMLSIKEDNFEKSTTEELIEYDLNVDTKSNILSLADKIKNATKAK